MEPLGVGILVVVLVAATAFALWRRSSDGRLRAASTTASADAGQEKFPVDDLGISLGERATLVQFSTAFCQPCRATRQVLTGVADVFERPVLQSGAAGQ